MSIHIKYTVNLNLVELNDLILLKHIVSHEIKIEFNTRVSELLECYKYLTTCINNSNNKLMLINRLIIIARYLRICKKYIPENILDIKHVESSDLQDICTILDCGGSRVEQHNGCVICTSCGIGQFIGIDNSTGSVVSNLDKARIKKKYAGDIHPKVTNKKCILEAMLLLQGKERFTNKIMIPQQCIDRIKANKNCSSTSTVSAIARIMVELDLKKYSSHVNYIWSKVTGQKLPDIHEYEDIIFSRYETMYRDAAHIIGKKNSNQKVTFPRDMLLLRSLLELENISIDRQFWPEIKTPTVRDNYNCSMKEAFAYLQVLHSEQKWLPYKSI